ncbi:MAG: hypothetical protein M3N26_11020, partial [Pseudomonadota bacterium]|nr:hypothetical protein [Pseudomonadota bacterium]
MLDSLPGELRSPATDNHILSFVVRGERHHRLWHDARLVHDGVLASKSINIVPAGSVPRAVVDTSIRVLHVYLPHSTLIDVAQSTGVPMGSLEIIDPKSAFDPPLINLLSALHDAVDASKPVDRLWRDCICQAVVARVLHRWSNLGQPHETRFVGGLSDREL